MDGVHVILEKEIVGEGEPVTKARYIPSVCMITKDNEENEVVRYYHEDALGSFVAMTDEDQNLTALYQYDAWGNELLAAEDIPNSYRWCGAWGYYRDPDAQMYLLGMRWYDPQTGRFISRDPIGFAGGDTNGGLYSGNDPVNSFDPLGWEVIQATDTLAGFGGIGILLRELAKWFAKRQAARHAAKKAAEETARRGAAKKLAQEIAECESIHAAYHALMCVGCKGVITKAEAAANAACLILEVQGRRAFLEKKCDYKLPGSIAVGSAKAEAGHREQLAVKSAALAFCLEKAAALPN
jgi:RHS repeat-associated protein